ncbi:MAG: serine hydrolase domain-containing protein [Chryseobacterium taeanense]
MKTKFLLFLIFVITISQSLFSQNITGSWKGDLDIQGSKLPLILNISQENNAYKATLDSPLQGAEGIPVDKVVFTDNDLALDMSSIGATYKGKFENGKFSGNFVQMGKTYLLIFEAYDKKNSKNLLPEVLKLSENINESFQKIDSFLSYLEKNNAEAGEISIFKDGKEIYKRNFGETKLPQSQKGKETFQIGSITKSMTAMMIFKLIEKNNLDLNDKLSKFYPKIPNADKITISQMLSHTSGLGDYVTGKDTMKWLQRKFQRNRS